MEQDLSDYFDFSDDKDLEEHPIAQKIFNIAQSNGVKLNDINSLIKIIEQVDSDKLSDPKAIIMLVSVVEKLILINKIFLNNKKDNYSEDFKSIDL